MPVDRISVTMDPELGAASLAAPGDVVLTSNPDDLNRLLGAHGVDAEVHRV